MKRYILADTTYKHQYTYDGPVYVNNRVFAKSVSLVTQAWSVKQAIVQFTRKIKDDPRLNRLINTYDRVSIDEKRVKDVTTPPHTTIQRCSRCGRQLNDQGECTVCDLHVDDWED